MLKEFREFIARGNVLDLAVAVIIGAAFGRIVSSLVEGVLMPPIGQLLGRVDFSSLFWIIDSSRGVPSEPTKRDCPYCLTSIPVKARRCAACCADLAGT
jgi:large-conductance mechanosensitive channel